MVVGKGDNALLPAMMLGDGVLNWHPSSHFSNTGFYNCN